MSSLDTIKASITSCIQELDDYAHLNSSAGPGSFCSSGALPLSSPPLLPLISVDGVCDPLSFPLPPSQCAALIAVAQRAPFGRGSETVVDVAVRNTWQLDCSAVHVDSAFLETIRRLVVPRVCGELGVSLSAASVDARLYKLLVYETGGFFRAHRDTEKEDGMFGTLVVLLPVQYTGGELVVEHAGQRRVIDCSAGELWRGFSYAAFYADCRHQIQPVTSGHRVALTFNLCRRSGPESHAHSQLAARRPVEASEAEEEEEEEEEEQHDDEASDEDEDAEEDDCVIVASSSSPSAASSFGIRLPSAASLPETPAVGRQLATALSRWSRDVAAGRDTNMLVLKLEHEYTASSLSVRHLKNHDRALMALVDKAIELSSSTEPQRQQPSSSSSSSSSPPSTAPLPPVIPLLCLFYVSRTGYEDCDEDDFDTTVRVEHIAAESTGTLFSSLVTRCTPRVEQSAILHTEEDFSWSGEAADDQHENQYTGNEGATTEYIYHRAGILLLLSKERWSFVARHLSVDVSLTELQEATSLASTVDLDDCVQLASELLPRLTSTSDLHTFFLDVLCGLHDRATEEAKSDAAVSRHADQLSALMQRLLTTSAPAFSAKSAATQLDKLISVRAMDKLRAALVSSFKRSLTEPPPASSSSAASASISSAASTIRPSLSLLDAASFLLRLFLLHFKPRAAVAASAPPVFDGSMASVRAICSYVLTSPQPYASFTFPASLSKESRHQVHIAADAVGFGKLRHESAGTGRSRALTLTRAAGVPPPAVDVLRAFVSQQPLSIEAARLPAHWVQTTNELCEVLCGELNADRLQNGHFLGTSLLHSQMAETSVVVLLLFVVYQAQRGRDAVHRAHYTARYVDGVVELCQFVLQHIEQEWSNALAASDVAQLVEQKLIALLLPLIDLLLRPQPALDGTLPNNRSPSLLLAAVLPLLQRVLSWLQAQQASIPQLSASSWTYPTEPSPLFPLAAPNVPIRATCTCALCQQLERFLKSDMEQTLDFPSTDSDRKHIEQRVQTLSNPHLRSEVVRSLSPPVLRVVKHKLLATLWDERRVVLQTSVDRLATRVAAITNQLAASGPASAAALVPLPASSSSTSSSSSSSRPSSSDLSPVASRTRAHPAAAHFRAERHALADTTQKRKREVIEVDSDEVDEEEDQDKENKRHREHALS